MSNRNIAESASPVTNSPVILASLFEIQPPTTPRHTHPTKVAGDSTNTEQTLHYPPLPACRNDTVARVGSLPKGKRKRARFSKKSRKIPVLSLLARTKSISEEQDILESESWFCFQSGINSYLPLCNSPQESVTSKKRFEEPENGDWYSWIELELAREEDTILSECALDLRVDEEEERFQRKLQTKYCQKSIVSAGGRHLRRKSKANKKNRRQLEGRYCRLITHNHHTVTQAKLKRRMYVNISRHNRLLVRRSLSLMLREMRRAGSERSITRRGYIVRYADVSPTESSSHQARNTSARAVVRSSVPTYERELQQAIQNSRTEIAPCGLTYQQIDNILSRDITPEVKNTHGFGEVSSPPCSNTRIMNFFFDWTIR